MATKLDKEIRFTPETADDYEFYRTKFRVLCAVGGETEAEAVLRLMRGAVAANEKVSRTDYVTYAELCDIMQARHGITLNRQLIYNHRLKGLLDGLYVESKPQSNAPTAKHSQKLYFDLEGCEKLYTKLYPSKNQQTKGV